MLEEQIKLELNKINSLINEFNNHRLISFPLETIEKQIQAKPSELESKFSQKEIKSIINHALNHETPLMKLLTINLENIGYNKNSYKDYPRKYVEVYEKILAMLLKLGADFDALPQDDKTKSFLKNFTWIFNENYIKTPITTEIIQHILDTKLEDYSIRYQDPLIESDITNNNHNAIPYGLQILINYAIEAPFSELEKIGINANHLKLMFRALILGRIGNVNDSDLKNKCNKFLTKFITHTPQNEGIIEDLYSFILHKYGAEKDFDVYKKAYFLSLIELNNLPADTKQDLREILIKETNDPNELYKQISFLIHLDINNHIESHKKNNKNPEQLEKVKNILDTLKKNNATKDLEEILLHTYSFAKYDEENNTLSEHAYPWDIYLILFLEKALQFQNTTITSKYIPQLSNIHDEYAINNLETFFKSLLTHFFEKPIQERNQIVNSLQVLVTKFDNNTSKKLKNEVYYAILALTLLNNEIPDTNTQIYCLENLDLLTRLPKKMLFKLMQQISPSLVSIDPRITNNLFKNFLSQNQELFLELLNDKTLDNKAQCQYIVDNFKYVLKQIRKTSRNYSKSKRKEIQESLFIALQQFLSKTKQKIPFTDFMYDITSFETLESIIKHKLVNIPDPSLPIIPNNARVNPIIIAADAQNVELFLEMYAHRTKEPWQTYWKHAGDPESKLIIFLLKMPIISSDGYSYTVSYQKCKEMLLEALNNKSVIENLRGEHLINPISIAYNDESRNVQRNWNDNLKILNKKLSDKNFATNFYQTNDIKKLLRRFLNLEKTLVAAKNSSLKLAVPDESSEAHDNRVYTDSSTVFNNDFISFLNERYPNASYDQQIKNAFVDTRILIIKNLIEYKITHLDDIKIRDKIISLCGLEEFFSNYSNESHDNTFTFADFKNKYYINNNKFIEMVNPSNNENSELSEYLQNIHSISAYEAYCKSTWAPFAVKLELQRYAKDASYQHALIYDKPSRNFALFTMLLATDDIASKINKLEKDNFKSLYLFANNQKINDPQYLAARSIIQSKILKEKIDPKNDLNWEQLKSIIIKTMSSEQKYLSISFSSSIEQCMKSLSCDRGVFARFSTAVLSKYYKYANDEFNFRSNAIQEIMFEKFRKKFEKKLVHLILQRLQPKESRFSFFAATKQKNLHSPVLKKFVKDIYENKKFPEELQALMNKINAITNFNDKVEVINALFPSLKIYNISNALEIIEHDQEIANLFDAFFTINTNNFFELFSGSKDILKYSSQLKDNLEYSDRISIENFEQETGRSAFLAQCFNPLTINNEVYRAIKSKDKIATSLSKYEKALIKFYSIAIAEAHKLKDLSASLLANLKLICDIKNPTDDVASVIIARNDNINELQSEINEFRIILKKTPITQMELTITQHELKNSLNKAIEAQYWRTHSMDDINFEFRNQSEFDDKLSNASIDNIVSDCSIIAKYLVENKDLRESYSNTERFPDITDIIEDLAYIAHEMFGEKSEVYQSCFNLAKALDIDNCLENQDAWKTSWGEKMKTKKRDYDIL